MAIYFAYSHHEMRTGIANAGLYAPEKNK